MHLQEILRCVTMDIDNTDTEIYIKTWALSDDGERVLRTIEAVSYTHLRAHETVLDLVCRLLLEKQKKKKNIKQKQHTTN